MHLTLVSQKHEGGQSGNVIAEVPGRDPKAPILLVGGHLDSWDLATGAIDDAPGVAIMTAAAKHIMDAGRPLRTIRVVWFGAEEPGGFGGKAYAAAHGKEPYAIAGESDFGADRVWRFSSQLAKTDPAAYAQLAAALAPLGITRNDKGEADGTDVEPTIDAGAPWISLSQDGTRYFDYHHTPDDTLDKIDPAQLRQNVAAWTAVLAVLSGGIEAGAETASSGVEPRKPREEIMRIALAIPLLLLGACQVSKDDNNGTTSVTYNSDVAENAAADIGNTAQNIAADIGNDVQKTGDKIENKVGNADVSVKVDHDEHTDDDHDDNDREQVQIVGRSHHWVPTSGWSTPRTSGAVMVGETGFEPATLCSQSRCATRLRHSPTARS